MAIMPNLHTSFTTSQNDKHAKFTLPSQYLNMSNLYRKTGILRA